MNPNIRIPIGYRFNPDEDQIYAYYIPKRILQGGPVSPVEELELYGSQSPNELFGDRDEKDIYFFTSLKKEKPSHNRARRGAGGGTWRSQKPTPCIRQVYGTTSPIEIGTMRQYTYKEKDGSDWIMHEYKIDEFFLKYKLRRFTNYVHAHAPDNLNPENIVFCHIYKKGKKDDDLKGERGTNNNKKRKISTDDYIAWNNNKNTENNTFDYNNFQVTGSKEFATNSIQHDPTAAMMSADNNYVPDQFGLLGDLPPIAVAAADDLQDYLMANFD